MGQGRKKSQRNYTNHHRRRSIHLDVDNQESMEVMQFLGPAAVIRNRLENRSITEGRKRKPTPFPKTSSEDQYPSDFVSVPMSKTRTSTSTSPTNILLPDTVPFVSTSVTKPSFLPEKKESTLSTTLVSLFFKDSWVFQNDCRRELSESSRRCLEDVFDSLLLISPPFPHIIEEATHLSTSSLLHSLFYDKREAVIRFLVNGCRYERIYGLSIHIAVIDLLLPCFPDLQHLLIHSLYETVLDFYETERLNGDRCEDSLYVQETEYGQIHRIVELWSAAVHRAYSHVCSGGTQETADPFSELFLRTGLVLLQLSSVVRKYREVLIQPFIKLLYLNGNNVHFLLHAVTTKLPVTCPRKLTAWLEFLCDLLGNCPIFLSAEYSREITCLLGKIMRFAVGSHIDCSMQSLTLLSNKCVLVNYILSNSVRSRMLEKCLYSTQDHWNQAVREKGEELFDLLLDYIEA